VRYAGFDVLDLAFFLPCSAPGRRPGGGALRRSRDLEPVVFSPLQRTGKEARRGCALQDSMSCTWRFSFLAARGEGGRARARYARVDILNLVFFLPCSLPGRWPGGGALRRSPKSRWLGPGIISSLQRAGKVTGRRRGHTTSFRPLPPSTSNMTTSPLPSPPAAPPSQPRLLQISVPTTGRRGRQQGAGRLWSRKGRAGGASGG